jgi:S-adenosylmethionine synthetase
MHGATFCRNSFLGDEGDRFYTKTTPFHQRSFSFVFYHLIFFVFMTRQYITSESVTEGHPDKVCDQISDAILDAILTQDSLARVAVETVISDNFLALCGEVTTTAIVDYKEIAKSTIRNIGYISKESGFDPETAKIIINIHTQSPDIAQ